MDLNSLGHHDHDWRQTQRVSRGTGSRHSFPDVWVATRRAIQATGLSRSTLHRWVALGLVEEGQEFRNGLTLRSPRRWNIFQLEKRIAELRMLAFAKDNDAPGGGSSVLISDEKEIQS